MRTLRQAFGRIFAERRMQPAIVCIGHSHSEPVAAAAASAGFPVEVLNFWHLENPITIEKGRPRLSAALCARLVPPVFSLVGGAVHQDVGLVVHSRPFDFIWPERPGLPLAPGAEIIPFAAVQAALLQRARYFLDIMSEVRDATPGPVFHLESPPAFEQEELPENDPGFYHFFGKEARFSPPWLRFKLWRLHSAIVAAHCSRTGIGFIAHPPESVTAEGFLRPEYHGTPAHANAAYGGLLLRQMEAVGKGLRARPARAA